MLTTNSYDDDQVVPRHIRDRYKWIEVGSAAAVLKAISPEEFADLLEVLDQFQLTAWPWLVKGGNKGDIAATLDRAFRERGWKETRIDTEVRAHYFANFSGAKEAPLETWSSRADYSAGYRVDNHKGRMIVDIEWNAKDGNLDRDLGAYRSWYEHGVINGGVIITKDRLPLLKLARDIWGRYQQTLDRAERNPKLPVDLSTATTTSLDKANDRLLRQGAGTCPVLIIGVSDITWDGSQFRPPPDGT